LSAHHNSSSKISDCYYYYYYYYEPQLSFHSVAVALTLVQTKQIVNIHKRNNTKTAETIQNTKNTSTHITKTPTHYKTRTYAHPRITKPTHTHTHALQNPHIRTPTHYKTHTYAHPHFTKPTHTHTHTLQNKLKQPSTRSTQMK